MVQPPLFQWRYCAGEIIVCGVRWYLRYALSYRDVEELRQERGGSADHTTVFRWVQRYAPDLDERWRPYLTATHDSYRVAETDSKIKKQRSDLYRTERPDQGRREGGCPRAESSRCAGVRSSGVGVC
jgi:transposase-like protein